MHRNLLHFYTLMTKNLKVKLRKHSRITKAILKKEKGDGEIRLSDFRLYYKATVINTLAINMVLAQKQKYRSMEQDRKPRDKLTHIWSPYL